MRRICFETAGVVQSLIFFRSWTLVSRHKFSIKFKSGDWGGQTDVFTELQFSQVLVSADTCTGALLKMYYYHQDMHFLIGGATPPAEWNNIFGN